MFGMLCISFRKLFLSAFMLQMTAEGKKTLSRDIVGDSRLKATVALMNSSMFSAMMKMALVITMAMTRAQKAPRHHQLPAPSPKAVS